MTSEDKAPELRKLAQEIGLEGLEVAFLFAFKDEDPPMLADLLLHKSKVTHVEEELYERVRKLCSPPYDSAKLERGSGAIIALVGIFIHRQTLISLAFIFTGLTLLSEALGAFRPRSKDALWLADQTDLSFTALADGAGFSWNLGGADRAASVEEVRFKPALRGKFLAKLAKLDPGHIVPIGIDGSGSLADLAEVEALGDEFPDLCLELDFARAASLMAARGVATPQRRGRLPWHQDPSTKAWKLLKVFEAHGPKAWETKDLKSAYRAKHREEIQYLSSAIRSIRRSKTYKSRLRSERESEGAWIFWDLPKE